MLSSASLKSVSRLQQRVQREATGYYCGYTFKGQVVGRKYILQASKSLDYMEDGLEDKSEGQRMHRMTNRLFTDMQHRCVARPAAEEWNLGAFAHEQDVTNAEFMRTFRSVDFPGGQLVKRLEDEMTRKAERSVSKLLAAPQEGKEKDAESILVKHLPDLYGFRGFLPDCKDVYYLNPWEFLMLWEVRQLPRPTTIAKTAGSSSATKMPPALTVPSKGQTGCDTVHMVSHVHIRVYVNSFSFEKHRNQLLHDRPPHIELLPILYSPTHQTNIQTVFSKSNKAASDK
jgi:hypothetical protein